MLGTDGDVRPLTGPLTPLRILAVFIPEIKKGRFANEIGLCHWIFTFCGYDSRAGFASFAGSTQDE